MNIVFFCQSCGARFEVDPRMAGKKGHCKKCGQYMSIPRAQEIASMAAMPALAMAGAGAVAGAAAGAGAARRSAPGSRREISQVGLAPITIDRMPAGCKRPSTVAVDDAEDSKPYALAKPECADRRGRVQAVRQRRREGLEGAARRGPEALPQDQPGRVPGLHPVPHDPAVRDRGRQPADGALRCDRGGPAQHRAAGRRERQPGRRPVPRRDRPRTR